MIPYQSVEPPMTGLISAIALVLLTYSAHAATVSATCGEPHGKAIGTSMGKDFLEDEGMTGGSVIFKVDDNARSVVVTTRDAASRVSTDTATLLLNRPDLITFLLGPDPSGDTWLYGLFPIARRAIMARIERPFFGGPTAAAGAVMQADCQFE